VPNLSNPSIVDKPYLTPNRKGAALVVPLYAGEIFLNTADGNCYVAVPPIGVPISGWAATDWCKYAYGFGVN
jgi:hypothetical protein